MSNFDEKSKKWDSKEKAERNNELARIIKENVDISKVKNVLEFGCGTGQLGLNFVSVSTKVTFIDSSSGMIDVLNNKIEEQGIQNTLVYNESIEDHVGEYDLIISSMVFHHLDSVDDVIQKLRSCLVRLV